MDDVNENWEHRFLIEANTVLDKATAETRIRDDTAVEDDAAATTVTPLNCKQTIVSDCLLEKLCFVANKRLHQQRRRGNNKTELSGLIILHVLCAAR